MEKVNQIHIVPNGGEFDGDDGDLHSLKLT